MARTETCTCLLRPLSFPLIIYESKSQWPCHLTANARSLSFLTRILAVARERADLVNLTYLHKLATMRIFPGRTQRETRIPEVETLVLLSYRITFDIQWSSLAEKLTARYMLYTMRISFCSILARRLHRLSSTTGSAWKICLLSTRNRHQPGSCFFLWSDTSW